MLNNLNKAVKDEGIDEACKISSSSSLSSVEETITKIKNNNMPFSENFQENLKMKILEERHEKQSNMKNFNFSFVLKPQFVAFALIILLVSSFLTVGVKYYSPNKEMKVAIEVETEKKIEIKEVIKGVGKKLFALTLVKPVFADFAEMKNSVKPILQGGRIKIGELMNFNAFAEEKTFTDEQKKALEETGFFLANNNIIGGQEWGIDDFVDMYQDFGGSTKYYREPQNSVFITSDLGLHLYHILIDRSFQKMEETKFHPRLEEMTKVLFKDSIENYKKESDPQLKETYKRLSAYYLVPLVILDKGNSEHTSSLNEDDFETYGEYMNAMEEEKKAMSKNKLDVSFGSANFAGFEIDAEIYEIAKKELELINDAKELKGFSPLFTPLRPRFANDYTQFKPRSHYTKNNILKTYFMAMMWYGRMGFTLNSPELTRDALVITGQVNTLKVGEKNLSDQWAEMMVVIDFFVGEVDDLTPFQYTEAMEDVYGDEITDSDILSDKQLDKFIKYTVNNFPSPRILSEVISNDPSKTKEEVLKDTMQFRFMGQRFTPDAYVLNQLTQGMEAPDKETGQRLPSMATALMPISIISPDNKIVKNYLDNWVEREAKDSDKIIVKVYKRLKAEFAEYDESVWTGNIYWNWLGSFRLLLRGYGEGYPFFMQSEAWVKKNLGTVLGSYTELKHDTLLYAKQSYAELGGGGGDEENPALPPVPKGYVEPDLEFWNKIVNLAELTQKGLTDRDFFPEEFGYKYESFIKSAKFFRDFSEKELKNEKISDEEFEKLRTVCTKLRIVVAPLINEEPSLKEKRAGIVADIHTDAAKGKILYEGTGKPNIIYVAVSDVNGTRLTRGATFNHYEFKGGVDERLSDEDWQESVYDEKGELPEEDIWVKELKK